MTPFQIIIILTSYFFILFVISYFTGKKAGNDAFFNADKKSPWYVVAFGMIGASLSGVTFISVPGWVGTTQFSYMQMVLGYILGYFVVANVLMPVYYKLNLTSIYTYLEQRFGRVSYKTGASLFLFSRVIGASFRLYLVANVLQMTIFNAFNIPFWITVTVTILLIWLYTFKGGIKTIVWTDTLQTLFMLLAIGFSIYFIANAMNLNFYETFTTIKNSEYSRIFFFDNPNEKSWFFKQFFSGAFITIVMTGLDQDMMQKNLTCKNINEAKKNMYWYGIAFVPANLLFMSLGVLLYIFASQNGIAIPEKADDLFPLIATQGYLPQIVTVFFMLGLIAAAYSSADSALTSLTTSFSIDILEIRKKIYPKERKENIRKFVHIGISVLLGIVILMFGALNNESVISSLFKFAGYTYGPLLGLYAFGFFTKYAIHDKYVWIIAVLSPVICIAISIFLSNNFNYHIGFELLIYNGLLTFMGLFLIKKQIIRN